MAKLPYRLTDADWHRIEPNLPRSSTGGKPRVDDRVVLSAILHSLASGAPLDALTAYGVNPNTLQTRYRRWTRDGTLARVCEAIDFKPLTGRQRHYRQQVGAHQRQVMAQRGWSRWA